jgi:hypothetical protein
MARTNKESQFACAAFPVTFGTVRSVALPACLPNVLHVPVPTAPTVCLLFPPRSPAETWLPDLRRQRSARLHSVDSPDGTSD